MTTPFKCPDGYCGQEDCQKCHPENFIYNEEGDYYYFEGEANLVDTEDLQDEEDWLEDNEP
jgi:hypothetical protein